MKRKIRSANERPGGISHEIYSNRSRDTFHERDATRAIRSSRNEKRKGRTNSDTVFMIIFQFHA